MRHFVNNMFVIANTMLLVLGLVVAPQLLPEKGDNY